MDFYRPPTLQGVLDALGSVNKALRAWKFYPQGHPSRKSSIKLAHDSMLSMLDNHNLSLNIGRTDFSFPDGESLKDTTHMSSGLSYELFIRRVRKITFLCDMHQEDLLDFLRLLTIPPEDIHKTGGMDKLMAEHGIQTIWVNEFDLSIIDKKRRDLEQVGIIPQGVDEIELGGNVDVNEPVDFIDEINPVTQLRLLLGRLITTVDADIYRLIILQAVTCSETLKKQHEFSVLFPLLELLADHASNSNRSENLRECARFGLEQLVMGDGLLEFILDRMEQADDISHEAIQELLITAGQVAIDLLLERIAETDSLSLRKVFSTFLVNFGETAVPTILRMINDKRWYIVRNLAAILGDIGSQEAVFELQNCLLHSDIRVCNEAIRSLAKIGGRDAETAIIGVLHADDPALFPQVIASLGGMKSRKAVVDLTHIICRHDFFLKQLPLKIDALGAIAMIGDRQLVPVLVDLLASRHFIVPGRWKQFKIAIAGCLARLGDARALPILKKKASDSGELGRACAEAAEAIERTGG